MDKNKNTKKGRQMTTYRCNICKIKYKKVGPFKGFKAPVNDDKRERWSRSCGVKLVKYARICANHFTNLDFIEVPNRSKRCRLKPGALPKPYLENTFNDEFPLADENISSEITILNNKIDNNLNTSLEDGNDYLEETIVDDQQDQENNFNMCCVCLKPFDFNKVGLYGLPTNEKYRKCWFSKLGKSLPPDSQICEQHFRPEDFIITLNERQRLKKEAIPSQNLNVLYLNQIPQLKNLESSKNPLGEENIPESTNIVCKKPKVSSKSIQTDVGYTRTCGYIEVSVDYKKFSMNCFYCDKVYPIWKWGEFATHIKEFHEKIKKSLPKKAAKSKSQNLDIDLYQEENKDTEINIDKEENEQTSKEDIKNNLLHYINDNTQESIKIEEISVLDIRPSTSKGVADVENPKTMLEDENEIDIDIYKADLNITPNWPADIDLLPNESKQTVKDEGDFFNIKEKDKKPETKENEILTVPCYLCEKLFRDEEHLQDHKVLHHNAAPVRKIVRRGVAPRHCTICKKTFRVPNELRNHMALHKPPEYKCHICHKEFRWILSFKDHLKLHSNTRDHVCEICGASFIRYTLFLDHKKVAHSDERKYPCQICGNTFKTSSQLSFHRRKHHLVLEGTVEELHTAKFYVDGKRRRQLKKYEVIEDPVTKQSRVKCDLCDNNYARHSGLAVHRQRAHGKWSNKNYKRKRGPPKCLEKKLQKQEKKLVEDTSNLLESDNDKNFVISDTEELKTSVDDLIDYDSSDEVVLNANFFENVI